MRKREWFGIDREAAIALLAAAPVVRLAGTTEGGLPVLRALHAVVQDGAIWFHAAPVGEKREAYGRPAVIAAEEVVATIPSYVFDPERACPATTYYRGVQAHGVLEVVRAPEVKARVLQALMEKYQPEGGYAPITADDPRYRGQVRGVEIIKMSLETVDGKAKLGQNRAPAEIGRVLEFLWRRGEPGDPRAVDLVRAYNPEAPTPAFLESPPGTRLRCALGREEVAAACELLAGEYWNVDVSRDRLARGQLESSAWVGACDEDGRLIATARAVSDGARVAYVLDVAVARGWRGRGLGKALVRLLLDHPRVRGARRVVLGTRDAQAFYRGFGFVPRVLGESQSTEMVLHR